MKGEKSILARESGRRLFCSVVVGRVRESRRDLMQAAVRQLSLGGIGRTALGERAKALTTDHRQVSLSTTPGPFLHSPAFSASHRRTLLFSSSKLFF